MQINRKHISIVDTLGIKVIYRTNVRIYDIIKKAVSPEGEGVRPLDSLVGFFVSVIAGVVSSGLYEAIKKALGSLKFGDQNEPKG